MVEVTNGVTVNRLAINGVAISAAIVAKDTDRVFDPHSGLPL